MKLILQTLSDHSIGVAGTLYDCAARRSLPAHEQRDADETFVAHHGDLRRGTVRQHIQQRDDRVDRKIDVAQDIARLIQNLAERHRYELQVRIDALSIRGRQRCKQVVLLRIAKRVWRGELHGNQYRRSHLYGALAYTPCLGNSAVPHRIEPWRRAARSLAGELIAGGAAMRLSPG